MIVASTCGNVQTDVQVDGKPVYTFEGEYGVLLEAIGARTIPLSGVEALLQNTPRRPALPIQLARRDVESPSYCLAEIRREYPRAYMKWSQDEEALLQKLRSEGKSRRGIARELQRQPSAITSRIRKIEGRDTK